MKNSKKVIESVMVAAFSMVMMVTAMTSESTNIKADGYANERIATVAETTVAETAIAVKERANIEVVAAAQGTDKTEQEVKKEKKKSKKKSSKKKTSEWANKLMPNVEESLNIRAKGNMEAEVVGKLYKGAVAEVVKRGKEWSKIRSGNVEGYVKNEYCVYGKEAEAMGKEQGTTYATALTGGLRVRAEANAKEETAIVDVLEEGEKVKVDTTAEETEGWITVVCNDGKAYVSAEYVSVKLELGKAISIEEELAAIRKAEEEKAAKAAMAAKAAEAKKSSSVTTQKASVSASYDEVTLLGALIQCEAGGECYEGQVAVGAVVMNRLRSGFAGSISGVIYQSGQFTPVASGALARTLANGVSGSCLQAAQEAINGVDNVNGALSFRNVRSGRSGIVIGNHVFF